MNNSAHLHAPHSRVPLPKWHTGLFRDSVFMTLTFADEVEDDLHLLSEASGLIFIVSDLPLDGQPLAVTATLKRHLWQE